MKGKARYIMRLTRLYHSYRRRDTVVPVPPLRLWVEISSRCNLLCPACPNQDLAAAEKGDMAWPLFQKVIDQGREFAWEFNLHHRGETLLHPEAGRFIHYAAGQGVYTRLHSNATLLTPPLSTQIIASDLQRLSISFDGFEAPTYEKNRVGASFEQVTTNIETFLRLRRQAGKSTPKLAVEVMELSPEPSQKNAQMKFASRFRKLGLDELVIKKPHNWAGHLGSPTRSGRFSPCTFPWNALLVFFTGEVLPCAQDFFGRFPLGNAQTDPLLELWNGRPMQDLRRAHAAGHISAFPACANCDRVWRPTWGGLPREFMKRLIFRRMP